VLEPPGAPDPVTLSAAAVVSLLPVAGKTSGGAAGVPGLPRSHTCCG